MDRLMHYKKAIVINCNNTFCFFTKDIVDLHVFQKWPLILYIKIVKYKYRNIKYDYILSLLIHLDYLFGY